MLSWASAEGKRPANSRREAAPLSAVWRSEESSRPNSTVLSQRRSESIDYCGLRLRRRAVSRYWPSSHFPPGCSERSLD